MPQQLEDDGDRLFVRDLEGRVDGQALQVSRDPPLPDAFGDGVAAAFENAGRSEEHTSELQSLMRLSYAAFCLKKDKMEAGNSQCMRELSADTWQGKSVHF